VNNLFTPGGLLLAIAPAVGVVLRGRGSPDLRSAAPRDAV
jgi:hypothetical protein